MADAKPMPRQKQPREYAFEICNQLTAEKRRAALAKVPQEIRGWVKDLVEQWFRMVDPIARRLMREKNIGAREQQLQELPAAIQRKVRRRMDELLQEIHP